MYFGKEEIIRPSQGVVNVVDGQVPRKRDEITHVPEYPCVGSYINIGRDMYVQVPLEEETIILHYAPILFTRKRKLCKCQRLPRHHATAGSV